MESKYTYSAKFYLMLGAGLVGLAGGLYYLYNLFAEEEISEIELIKIDEIAKKVEESKGVITQEVALQLLAKINKLSEDIIKKQNSDLEMRRREAINNDEEYQSVCMEYLRAKEEAYMTAMNMILQKFNITYEELSEKTSNLSMADLEKQILLMEKPDFPNGIPTKEVVKEAYLFFGSKFSTNMETIRKETMNPMLNYDKGLQEAMMINFIVMKLKIDDELFLRFNYNELQIRSLLYEYNLFNDPDIQQIHKKIVECDAKFGM